MTVTALELAWQSQVSDPVIRFALLALADGARPHEVAGRCGLEADEASAIVQQLEDEGLIQSTPEGILFRAGRRWVDRNGQSFGPSLPGRA